MKYRLEDYQRALDRFLDDLRSLDSDLVSALLFGSLARGDVRPGKSDLLDAYLVLRSEVCQERQRFMRSLEVMVEACQHLQQTGLPTHPFFFCFEHERHCFHAMHLMFWHSDETSRVLSGEDVRARLRSRAESRAVARTSFFQVRQMAHQLSRYLHQDSLPDTDRAEILHGLITIMKHMPRLACMALDIWVEEVKEVQELERALSGLETGVLSRIMSFRDCPAPASDICAWRRIITDALAFSEQLHDLLMERLFDDSVSYLSDRLARPSRHARAKAGRAVALHVRLETETSPT